MEKNAKILLCDENSEERKRLADFLTKSGFHYIDEVSNGESAVDKMLNNTYDVAVVDLWVPAIDGIGIIRNIQKSNIK